MTTKTHRLPLGRLVGMNVFCSLLASVQTQPTDVSGVLWETLWSVFLNLLRLLFLTWAGWILIGLAVLIAFLRRWENKKSD